MHMEKKHYLVCVDTIGVCENYTVVATSAKEAKEKAKALFIKSFWKRSLLRATIEDTAKF